MMEGTSRMRVGDGTLTVPRHGGVLVWSGQLRQVFNDTDAEVLGLIIGAPEELEFLQGSKSNMDLELIYPIDPTQLPKELTGVDWPPNACLRLLHEASLQADGDAIHLARDFVVAVAEADGPGLRTAFQHLCAAELQVFDEDDAVAVSECVAVSVLDDAWSGGRFGSGASFPFVAAGHAFIAFGVFQNLGHFTHRADRFAHEPTG